jgi:hypothetical protein
MIVQYTGCEAEINLYLTVFGQQGILHFYLFLLFVFLDIQWSLIYQRNILTLQLRFQKM